MLIGDKDKETFQLPNVTYIAFNYFFIVLID